MALISNESWFSQSNTINNLVGAIGTEIDPLV